MWTKEEIIDECVEMFENGAGSIEILEFIEEHTDIDPAEIICELF